MKVYHGNNCHFTFRRVGNVECCPDCEKQDIRPATKQEIKGFKECVNDGWDKR